MEGIARMFACVAEHIMPAAVGVSNFVAIWCEDFLVLLIGGATTALEFGMVWGVEGNIFRWWVDTSDG